MAEFNFDGFLASLKALHDAVASQNAQPAKQAMVDIHTQWGDCWRALNEKREAKPVRATVHAAPKEVVAMAKGQSKDSNYQP